MQTGRGGRFEEIDVLRGLAALCVVLSHYSSHCVRFFGDAPFHLDLDYGFYAVQLFFTISGFVIYYTLEKSRTWRDFAFARATRLYPVYWVALTLTVAIGNVVFGSPIWWGGYITNLTMLQEYLGFGNIDNVFWSLTVELVFYVIMALVFAAGLLGRIEVVAVAWLVLACLWALFEQRLGVKLPAFLPRYLILPHVPFFMAGIMFYLIAFKGVTRSRIAIIVAALATAGWLDGLAGLTVAAVIFTIFGMALTGRLRFLVSPVTLWLGAISYPLYLSHRNIGYLTLDRLFEAGVPIWIALAATIAGALVLASALAYLVERPALRFLRRKYRTRFAAAPA